MEIQEFSGIGRKQYRKCVRALRDIPKEDLPQFWEEFVKATEKKKRYHHFRSEMLWEIEAKLINSLPLDAKCQWQRVKAEKGGRISFEDVFSFWRRKEE